MRKFALENASLVREDRAHRSQFFAWVDTAFAWTDR